MRRREAKAAGSVDYDSWEAVVRFYGGLCAHCEQRPWSQRDHCVPLSRGGKHEIGNLVPSCAADNYRKGTRTMFPRRRHPFMAKVE